MKKIYLTLLACLAVLAFSFACDAQSTSSQKREVKEKSKCAQAAKESYKGELRAFGKGVSQRDYTAEKKALLRAKGNLISAMKSYVSDVANEYDKEIEKDGDRTMTEEFVSEVSSKASGTLEHYDIVCSQLYELPDDVYESQVCISIPYLQMEKTVEANIITVSEQKGTRINPEKLKASQRAAREKYIKQKEEL
ncbi:MAG: hypothetical protein K2L00_02595 [Muribaculaceae bacterium]|nr:hypothetical protein [Muribaculaceae bacterium]